MTKPLPASEKFHIVQGKTVSFDSPHVMGILNVTPDSFADGGQYNRVEAALDRIEIMLQEGATIIDIGGESTRPGSDPVTVQEELSRVIPVLEKAVNHYPEAIFSVDTTKYEVALAALQSGVHYINDVSGLRKEPRFLNLCLDFDAGLMLMHSLGDPKTMQQSPHYEDVAAEVISFLLEGVSRANSLGVNQVVIDPGIGFGKTLEHNLTLLRAIPELAATGFPVLIGASRKSIIGQMLDGRPAPERLAGTIALHTYALMQGASIIRVHDVREAVDSLRIVQHLKHG
jgi:dihydropteroate synthase